jgi:hypothetical protein
MFEWKRILILSCFLYCGTASAAWIEGETHSPECQDALRHAEATYRSRASRLHTPDEVSRDLQSDAVLASVGVLGSREHNEFLRADPLHFDTLPMAMSSARPLYWSRSPTPCSLSMEELRRNPCTIQSTGSTHSGGHRMYGNRHAGGSKCSPSHSSQHPPRR